MTGGRGHPSTYRALSIDMLGSRQQRQWEERLQAFEAAHGPEACWIWPYKAMITKIGLIAIATCRVIYAIRVGPIAQGQVVMHSCDCPQCVNPGHLTCGTQADNMLEMMIKGRSGNGGPERMEAIWASARKPVWTPLGVYPSVTAAAKDFGLTVSAASYRARHKTHGWRLLTR